MSTTIQTDPPYPTTMVVTFTSAGKVIIHQNGMQQTLTLADLNITKSMLEQNIARIQVQVTANQSDIDAVIAAGGV